MATAYDNLLAWEDARKAREANEKAVSEVVLSNMEEKLEIGKQSCQELLKYVKELAHTQREYVRIYSKLGTSLNEHFFYGTLQNAVVATKKQNANASTLLEEQIKALNDNADQLNNLASEYASVGSKLLETSKKLGKDIENNRGNVTKNFALFAAAHDELVAAEKDGKVPTHDAWFLERTYHQSLVQSKTERDKLTAEMGALFEKFLKLEEKKAETIKNSLKLLATKQRETYSKLIESTVEQTSAAEAVNQKADQQLLVHNNFNRSEIVMALMQKQRQTLDAQAQAQIKKTAPTQDQMLLLQYNQFQAQLAGVPQATDVAPAVISQPFKTGFLNRQSSVIKSWKNNYFVLTPGFMYIFTNQDDVTPEYTLQLGSISVQHLQDKNEEPSVLELVTNPNSFFSSSRYVLKAENDEQMNEWITAIKSCSGSK